MNCLFDVARILQGVKVKMDDQGNILVKRLSGKNVYVKSISNAGEETSIGADVLKLPNYCLENDKPVKVTTNHKTICARARARSLRGSV